jgi:serine/threonine protein kinase
VIADVGCHNLILTGNGSVKMIDLEGCSIDAVSALSCYQWYSYRPPEPRVSRATDIFAFGCATIEMLSGRLPYHELEVHEDKYLPVGRLYTEDQFPDVSNLPLGTLIDGCWRGRFRSMGHVIQELESLRASALGQTSSASLASMLDRVWTCVTAYGYRSVLIPLLRLMHRDRRN